MRTLLALLVACGGGPAPAPSAADVRAAGALAPCPDSPNCVSSLADPSDAVHHTAPLPLRGDPATALDRLASLIEADERTEIVERDHRYLRATCTSRVFRFVDDVELLVDADAGVVHVRSASRLGYGDMGVNAARVEALRQAWDVAE
jgi:uncharacterized protein (DUF1499 family)